MRRIKAIAAGGAAVAALGCAVALGPVPLGDLADGVRRGVSETALNAALDASGAKSAIDAVLRSQAPRIAEATGRSPEEVARAIGELDIPSWGIGSLPADAVERLAVETSLSGIDAVLTIYDDPGYLTLEAGGQRLTLSVPQGAQDLISQLGDL